MCLKNNRGLIAVALKGTPDAKVASASVAELIVTLVASTPAYSACAVKPLKASKLVPVNCRLVMAVLETEDTVKKPDIV